MKYFNGNLTHTAEPVYEKSVKPFFFCLAENKKNNFKDITEKVQIKL